MVQEMDKKSFCVFLRCLRLEKQQNTQKCAEIYNGSSEGQEKSFCVFLRCLRLKTTEYTKEHKKIRVLRVIRWQQKKEIRC